MTYTVTNTIVKANPDIPNFDDWVRNNWRAVLLPYYPEYENSTTEQIEQMITERHATRSALEGCSDYNFSESEDGLTTVVVKTWTDKNTYDEFTESVQNFGEQTFSNCITADSDSNVVLGLNTDFTTSVLPGDYLRITLEDGTKVFLGNIATIVSDTELVLESNATSAIVNGTATAPVKLDAVTYLIGQYAEANEISMSATVEET